MTIPAGWYDDGSGRRRWWDGSAWTQHTLAAPATAVDPAPNDHSAPPAVASSASMESPASPAGPSPADASPAGASPSDTAAFAAATSATAASTPVASDTAASATPASAAFAPPWVLPGTVPADSSAPRTTGAGVPGYPGVHPGAAGFVPTAPEAAWSAANAYPGASHPGWSSSPAPEPPRAFPVLGVIALSLAVLGAVLSCVPAIAVAGWAALGLGFVLGIVSLFLRAPKWPGVSGMGVSVLGAFLAVAVVLISLGSTGGTTPEAGGTPVAPPTTSPGDDGHAPVPDDAERVGWADLEVGQCIPFVDWEEDVYYVPVVSCDEPHTDEVYLTFDIDDGEFPGDEEVGRIADERCVAEFETFVGHAYADSILDFYWSVPTQRTWRMGDREVVCIVYSYDDVTGTLQGAAR